MEDDWIFLGDGGAGVGSDSDDSATDDGSDSDSGFTILRRGRRGGADQCSVVVSDDDTPEPPRVAAAVAVPQPRPPGLSFKVVSYAEAFSASDSDSDSDSDSSSSEDGGGEAIVQGGAEEVEDNDSEICEEDDDDDDDDTDSSSEDEGDTDNSSEDEDEDTSSSSDEEDEDAFSSSDEEEDTSSSSDEEDAECTGEVDDKESTCEEDEESTSEEEGDDDPEISGKEEEGSNAACSVKEDDADSSGDESDDPESYGDEDDDEKDTVSSSEEEESSHVVDVAENGTKDIFAMLFPKAKACGANIVDDEDESEHGSIDYEENEDGSLFDIVIDMLLPRDHAIDDEIDSDSADIEDDDCLESGVEAGIVDVAENANQAIFDMLFPRAKACGANVVDDEDENEHGSIESEEDEDGPLFDIVIDMLLPRDHAIDDDMDTDSSDMEEDNCLESDEEYDTVNVAESGNLQDIFDMLFPRATACGANIDDYEDQSKHGSIDYEEEVVVEEEDWSLFDMLSPRDCAIIDDIDSSAGEDEAATATAACGYSAETSHGTLRPEFAGRTARGYDDIDTDSDMEEDDDEVVAADVNGTSLCYGWPRATTGGGVESQCWGFASQSQTERQALWEDLRRVLEDLRWQFAAEASESSGQQQQQQQQQQRSYDDVDDTCDVPGTAAAPGGGRAGSCARTPEAQFTARAVPDTERALATFAEVRRREAAQRELDRALAREAAKAAQALESALQGCPAKLDGQADFTFIIGVYVFVFLVVSLLTLALPSN